MVNMKEYNMSEEYIYVVDLDNKVSKAQGAWEQIQLEKEEIMKSTRKWSIYSLDGTSDPEEKQINVRKFYERFEICYFLCVEMEITKTQGI